MKTFETHSEKETAQIAQNLAENASEGEIICLQGDLGTGKSVFARAFIHMLAGDETNVPSPTFTLVQTYDAPKGTIWHFDLYRIENAEEIYELGWEEALTDGIILIEWPQRLGPLLPAAHTDIVFEQTGPESRKITIESHDK